MKTVTVNIQIQLDTINGTLDEVQMTLDLINNILKDAGMQQQPQIFTSALDESDFHINETEEEDEEFEEFMFVKTNGTCQSKWSELRDDYQDEGIIHIDGWEEEGDEPEDGHTIAKIDTTTGRVCYLDELARTDWKAVELINENVAQILEDLQDELDKTMGKCRDENF